MVLKGCGKCKDLPLEIFNLLQLSALAFGSLLSSRNSGPLTRDLQGGAALSGLLLALLARSCAAACSKGRSGSPCYDSTSTSTTESTTEDPTIVTVDGEPCYDDDCISEALRPLQSLTLSSLFLCSLSVLLP